MTPNLNAAIVRIRAKSNRVVGAGFLVGERKVLTCAHVVAQALGVPDSADKAPEDEITLDFPLVAPNQRLTARIVCWQPVSTSGTGDIAGLELTDTPPIGARAIRIVKTKDPWAHTFRAFGFPRGYDNGVWASEEATGWLQVEDLKQTGYFVAPGFSGGPVWDESLDGVVGMTVAADTTEGTRTAFIIPAKRLVAAWPELAMWTIPPCPYRGLLAFREQDAPFFFGREAFTERLAETVMSRTPTVVVMGTSGSGKSSVVFAGLLPRLRQADAGRPPGEEWAITQIRPGGQPFEALANGLLPLLEPEMTRTDRLIEVPKLAGALRRGDVALARVATEIIEDTPEAGRLLLVIDQFEELYTLCPDPDTRRAFLDVLIRAVASTSPHVHHPLQLVLTLRADFLGQALAYRPFADLLDQAKRLILGPMNREELEATIVRPAEQQGVTFEEGLVARILDDVGNKPGSLPLLEFALTQLWERQESNHLTHAAYEAIGELEGALTRHADQVYKSLSEAEQEQARQVFIQLVRPGEGTEDTRCLAARPELGKERWPLVQKLADTRLVVTGRDPAGQDVAEIAHEALIQRWGGLQAWMEEERDFRMWQERLRAALRQWEDSGRDAGALLRGVPLAEAKQRLASRKSHLGKSERAFIQASIDLHKRMRRRIMQVGFVPYLVLTLVIGSVGIYIVTRLVNSSLDERLTNHLLEAGRTVPINMERYQLNEHLGFADRLIRTEGVIEALEAGDQDRLTEQVRSQAVTRNTESVLLIDAEGQEIAHLIRENEGIRSIVEEEFYTPTLQIAQDLLEAADPAVLPRNDLGLHPVDERYYYFTTAPIGYDGETIGIIIVGTSLDILVPELQTTALADVTIYRADGKAIYTTFSRLEDQSSGILDELSISPELCQEILGSEDLLQDQELLQNEDFTVTKVSTHGRWYRLAYAPLQVGSQRIGVFSVALPADFVVDANTTARKTYLMIFAFASLVQLGIGYLIVKALIRVILEPGQLGDGKGYHTGGRFIPRRR